MDPSGVTPPIPARIHLLIDNSLLRGAVARVLQKTSDLLVVGQSRRFEATRESLLQSKCEVLVLDVFDPNWLSQCFEDTHRTHSGPRVLLISMIDDPQLFLAAVRCGVSGYLLSDASASEFIASVRALSRGQAHCPASLCLKLFEVVAQTASQIPDLCARTQLTCRQQNLVALLGKGMTNKEIASQLHLSEFTVKNHVRRIMRRLRASSRHEVVEKFIIPADVLGMEAPS